jgi:hypothetical protein
MHLVTYQKRHLPAQECLDTDLEGCNCRIYQSENNIMLTAMAVVRSKKNVALATKEPGLV